MPSPLKRLLTGCLMVVALAGYCRTGRADFFQFATIVNLGAVVPAPTSIVNNNSANVLLTTAANTPIAFTGLASVGPENLVGSNGGTDLVFGLIDVQVVNATPFQNISIPFTFDVTITDYPTDLVGVPNGSGTFSISGVISGTIGAGRRVNMHNISVDPVAPMLIGGKLYSMEFNTLVPPGPFFAGAIGAHVQIVPEPTTYALLGFGAIAVAGPAVRRWRRKPTAS